MDKPVLSASYDVELAKKVGVVAAALFNKIIYLSRYSDRKDGYCWRTADEIERELGISRKQQEGAIRKLEEEGLIKTKNTYIKNTKVKCKHFLILSDCAKKGNQISTNGGNQNSTKGTDQISTKEEDLYLKSNLKEKSDCSSQTEKEELCVAPEIKSLITAFCEEQGNEKTEEKLMAWMRIRRVKGAIDIEETVKANLEALPAMAKQSNMSINDYLDYIVRKGWKDLYPKGERSSPRFKTGAEAGITWNPDDIPTSSESDDDNSIPDDILDLFG